MGQESSGSPTGRRVAEAQSILVLSVTSVSVALYSCLTFVSFVTFVVKTTDLWD